MLALAGCAPTKVENVVQLTNTVGFEKAAIEDVRVYSLEAEAQNNEALQNKLEIEDLFKK